MSGFDVKKVAQLARLALDPARVEALDTDLRRILGYVEQLRAIDTTAVGSYDLAAGEPVVRDDVARETTAADERLGLAARQGGGFFLVAKVIGSGGGA